MCDMQWDVLHVSSLPTPGSWGPEKVPCCESNRRGREASGCMGRFGGVEAGGGVGVGAGVDVGAVRVC